MLWDVCYEGWLVSCPYKRAASTSVVGAVREPPILDTRRWLSRFALHTGTGS